MRAADTLAGAARGLLLPCLLLGLAGCALEPAYKVPAVAVPAAYKAPTDDFWIPATPGAQAAPAHWWQVFRDPALNALQARIDESTPTLAVALARYERARALAGEASAAQSPTVGVGAQPLRQRQSDEKPLRGTGQPAVYDSRTVQFGVDYELDFWGKVRNEVASGKAQADAAGDDLATARLSLHAQLADLVVQIRGADVQSRILHDAIAAYADALKLTENRFEGGVDSELAVTRARTQLADAQAQAEDVAAQRALLEHAIATLIGQPASGFVLAAGDAEIAVPTVPVGVPSTLLQRRPDIAAAERRTFAANADIGVARAAFYPSFSLSGLFGWQDAGQGHLIAAGNRIWALGPVAAFSLFDGGLRDARERAALASHDEVAAQYRATVLAAFQQVEDNLVLLQSLGREARDEESAAASAKQSEELATNRYREGAVNYLDVVTAQTSYLQTRRQAEAVRTRRLQASVGLIKALGGGWSAGAGSPS